MDTHTDPSTGTPPRDFFTWIRDLGLVRGPDSWLGGVCSAVAGRTGLDPLIVRGIVIVIAILGGPAFLVYAVAWALLPDSRGKIHAEQVIRGRWEAPSIAILVIAALTILPIMRGLWWQGPPGAWGMPEWLANTLGTAWTLALIGAVAWFVVWLVRKAPWKDVNRDRTAQQTPPAAYPGAASGSTPTSTTAVLPYAASPSTGSPTAASSVEPPVYGSPSEPPAAGATGTAPSAASSGPVDPAAAAREARERAAETRRLAEEERRAARLDARPGDRERAAEERERAAEERRRVADEYRAAAQERAEAARRRRPGAASVAIWFGIAALAAGVGAAIAAPALTPSETTLVALAIALVVLGLGTIVSGIRGRTSGPLGGTSVLLVGVLAVFGLVPGGSDVRLIGDPTWSVGAASSTTDDSHALLIGSATLDLSDLAPSSSAAGAGGRYSVALGIGDLDIIVPRGEKVEVEVRSLIGGLDRPDAVDDGGRILRDDAATTGSGTVAARVTVWSLIGDVTIVEDGQQR